jgi:hypothetical protein
MPLDPVTVRARRYLVHKLGATREQTAEYDRRVEFLAETGDPDRAVEDVWRSDPDTAEDFLLRLIERR